MSTMGSGVWRFISRIGLNDMYIEAPLDMRDLGSVCIEMVYITNNTLDLIIYGICVPRVTTQFDLWLIRSINTVTCYRGKERSERMTSCVSARCWSEKFVQKDRKVVLEMQSSWNPFQDIHPNINRRHIIYPSSTEMAD